MHTISLKRILIYLVLLVSFALLIGFTINIVSQVGQFEKSLQEQALSYTRIIASNAARTIVFDDTLFPKSNVLAPFKTPRLLSISMFIKWTKPAAS